MGNSNKSKSWSSRERLAFIERLAYWRGWVRRSDIVERFGISVPQASADISEYQRLNKNYLRYDTRAKRYMAPADAKLLFGSYELQNGLALLSEESSVEAECVANIDLPCRHGSPRIAQSLVRAVFGEKKIEIEYYSINSSTHRWRWITPHAFGYDGYRWHVRAWCDEDKLFKDFVLGRIASTRGNAQREEPLPRDADWFAWTVIRFAPAEELDDTQRRAIELDFGMRNGVAKIRVRRAMLPYTLSYLGLDGAPAPFRRLCLHSD